MRVEPATSSRQAFAQHQGLSMQDSQHVAILIALKLWPITEIAKAYGISKDAAHRAKRRWVVT